MIENLAERWLCSGITKGDTLLVHSNIRRTLMEFREQGYKVTPDDMLKSFLYALGIKGTLLLPLFNFDFTKKIPFDIKNSISQMGALTEAGRLYAGSVRTGHPIYSFAVIGHNAKEFENIDNESAYSEDSPFGILRRLNGKIASLDLEDQNSMTFYHHVEEVQKVNYRYFKDFTGLYKNLSGVETQKTYKIFVRDIDKGVVTNVNPAGELMWGKGLYKGFKPNYKSGLRTINACDMFEFVSDLISRELALNNLYSIKK
jgi:aminoglycoside 3-N-acetyltransferase